MAVAGCCDKAALERCRAEAAVKAVLLEMPSKPVNEGMRLDIRAASGTNVDASLVHADCVGGKAANAEVQVDWKVVKPEGSSVRASVGTNDVADKIWMESGSEGHGVTGPWIQGGALIQLRDSLSGTLLAEIHAVSQSCGGS